jgi:hypothetical protein
MKVMTSNPEFGLSYGTNYYDWASLGKAQVVDVGAAKGHFAIAPAKRYIHLSIVVKTRRHLSFKYPNTILI